MTLLMCLIKTYAPMQIILIQHKEEEGIYLSWLGPTKSVFDTYQNLFKSNIAGDLTTVVNMMHVQWSGIES